MIFNMVVKTVISFFNVALFRAGIKKRAVRLTACFQNNFVGKIPVNLAGSNHFSLMHTKRTVFRNIGNFILKRRKETADIGVLAAACSDKMNAFFPEGRKQFKNFRR